MWLIRFFNLTDPNFPLPRALIGAHLPIDIAHSPANALVASFKLHIVVTSMTVPKNPPYCYFEDREHHAIKEAISPTNPQPDSAFAGEEVALGLCLPPNTPHAISSSIPTWKDNVAYMEREKRVIDVMKTGYPRFVIHESVQRVCISQHLA